jgi:hypothetical protein
MALNQTSGNADSAVELLLAINTNDVPIQITITEKKEEKIIKNEECKMVLCVRNDLKMGLLPLLLIPIIRKRKNVRTVLSRSCWNLWRNYFWKK